MDTSINLLHEIPGEPFVASAWWISLSVWTLAIVMQRSCAACLWVLAAREAERGVRVFAAFVLAGIALVLHGREQHGPSLVYLLGGLGYFAVVACAAHWLGSVRPAPLSAGAVFVVSAFTTVLLPCLVVRAPEANIIRLLGFETMLAVHSYLIEAPKARAPISRSDALFFLCVNPTLVFPERGKRVGTPRLRLGAVGRIALGLITLAAGAAVGVAYVPEPSEANASFLPMLIATQTLSITLLHSGAASVQIGWMALLGWTVPERYDWPLLAKSPLDFWQRWNTYVGAWLRRYVFVPLSLRWCRGRVPKTHRALQAGAVLATFAIAGLLHDLANYPARFDESLAWTAAFCAAGAIVVAWLALTAAAPRLAVRALAVIGCVVAVQQLAVMGWILDRLDV